MNVLETLKVNNATILNIKEGDILFLRVDNDVTQESILELHNSLLQELKSKGLEDITIWVSKSVNDIKIIRR